MPATQIATRHVGRAPNSALLGAFVALTGLVDLEVVFEAIRSKSPSEVAETNVAAARAAHEFVISSRIEGQRGCSMLTQIEGSLAVAENGAMCWPEVICAYPITPETHIIEALGEMVQSGRLQSCEFINVESEFSALSVAIGASAAGVRAYTATASQGLLFMAEAVYNVSGIGSCQPSHTILQIC